MAEPYLTDLQSIVDDVSKEGQPCEPVCCKHFFSGAAAYTQGRIFMSLTKAGLALKLPQDDRDSLLGQGGKPLQYFPKAPVKKDYVVLPDTLRHDCVGIKHWVLRSIEFVGGGKS